MQTNKQLEEMWELAHKIVPEEHLCDINVKQFVEEMTTMVKLYAKKNHDYGNSFEQGMAAIGLSYGVGRLYDKMNRILTLMKVKAEVVDETIEDTIRDLACYAVMTSMYLNDCRKSLKASEINDVDFEGDNATISSTGEQN